jgi:hypothetical protein
MDYVKYDPDKFLVERAQQVGSALGTFILGESKLGATASAWVPIPMASFTYNADYQPDDNGTLIYGTESGVVSYSWWEGINDPDKLYPSDRLRVSYDGVIFFQAIVESTNIKYTADPEAQFHNSVRRVDFSANCASYYAVMMSKEISWKSLPKETALKRVQRWVKVVGW